MILLNMQFILALILFLFSFKPTQAANEFSTQESINYYLQPNGSANVNSEIIITNNFSQIYLQEYQVTLSGNQITNVQATDKSGNVLSKIDQNGNVTKLFLSFSNPAIGKNQQQKINLSYTIPNFSTKKGKTWEITLPQTNNNTNHQTSFSISSPKEFGDISFSSLKLSSVHEVNNRNEIVIDANPSNKKILIIFGNSQLFDFNIDYYLENTSSVSVQTEIALPPDTNSQKIIISQINPQPANIIVDTDGNWLAQYYLSGNSNINVNVQGQANLHSNNKNPITIDQSSYLKEQEYWPINSPKIKAITSNLSTPKSIYNFTVNHLSYDYNRLNQAKRMGGEFALTNPTQSLCTEFADLFVTLARSKNIPAREIEGYAYSLDDKIKPTNTNSDVLHAWAQYYDQNQNTWISVDPTWEKTTNGIDYFTDLDLNHFTFAIHGVSSNYPPPAGAYKSTNQKSKSLNISFADKKITPEIVPPTIKMNHRQFIIYNPNQVSLNNLKINNYFIATLPPYSHQNIQLKYNFFSPKIDLEITSDEINTNLNIQNRLLIISFVVILISFTIISIIGSIIFILTKHEKNS